MMNQEKTPLLDAVLKYIDENPVPMHIPSHKLGAGINPKWKDFVGENIFKMDLSELHGLDDLHQPKEAIKEAQELAADAWGADKSYFLANGTTSGIVASICSIVSEGEKIIIPRNAHKSAIFGLIISGATPEYVLPEVDSSRGLICGVLPETLEQAYSRAPNAKGVLGINPSYHGICCDLKSLIDITHKNNGIFIADEAHGNHVYFHEDFPPGALKLGADISCQSSHKMSGSLTQSSMLHLNSERVNEAFLKANLQLTQSTSPSYILMVSLDSARSYIAMEGHDVFGRLLPLIEATKNDLLSIPGIEVLGKGLIGESGVFDYEPMRIVFSLRALGLEGYDVYDMLRNEYNIEAEYGDHSYVVCVMGLGTKAEDLSKLHAAVKDISSKNTDGEPLVSTNFRLPSLPPMKLTPREAWFATHETIPWENAIGKVSAQMITPYPPGIPAICPGEIVTQEIHDYLNLLNEDGRHMHGPENGILDKLRVVK